MLFQYRCSQSSRWFRQPGSSANIHECGLRSDVNDTSVPAHADLIRRSLIVQMKCHHVIRSHIRAAIEREREKENHVLNVLSDLLEIIIKLFNLLSEKLIFAAVTREGFRALGQTTKALGEVMWNEV